MLNYPAMKSLHGLLLTLLFVPVSSLAQGVRMSADFFPLDVGKSWNYEVTNEAGEKLGQIMFAVEDYTIISGTSFYVLSDFPFSSESGEPVRFVRYDRSERYFLKRFRNDEGPLFVDAGATTEVLESDAGGAPQKFVLKTDRMALTFQRGVGIVEARLEQSGVVRIAKLVEARSKAPAGPFVGPAPGLPPPAVRGGAGLPPALPPTSPGPAARPESPVGAVTPTNPRIDAAVVPSAGGFRFALMVTNQSDSLIPFRFNSGKTCDFVVHEAVSGKEVWRWSNGNFFTQMLRSDSLRPKGKWQFEENWDGKDNDGRPVPPGTYRMTAIVASTPALQASPVVFEIR
jgi:hypothetical protein